jgi:hypothetical protein
VILAALRKSQPRQPARREQSLGQPCSSGHAGRIRPAGGWQPNGEATWGEVAAQQTKDVPLNFGENASNEQHQCRPEMEARIYPRSALS